MRPLRYTPPPLPPSPGLAWVLVRAFGPLEAVAPPEAEGAESLAERLTLSARIAARHGRQRLTDELGVDAAARMMERAHAAVRVGVLIETVARELASAGESAGVPVVFLKFAALHLSGRLLSGSRTCTDLDVLVPADRAARLREALLAAGFRSGGAGEYEHQLEGVTHPAGAVVEIHTCLLGVRVAGRRSAGYDALASLGLLERPTGAAGWVPAPAILAAHAAVHGLAQHGSVPGSYPMFRMLSDLADLPAEDERPRWGPWIARDVPPAELDALLGLRAALLAGRPPLEGDDAPALLLRHLVAGVLDDGYARSLRLGGVFREVTDRGRLASVLGQVAHAIFPGDEELERLYGPVATPGARLSRRLHRPVDLARRLARYGVGAWRPRRRGP